MLGGCILPWEAEEKAVAARDTFLADLGAGGRISALTGTISLGEDRVSIEAALSEGGTIAYYGPTPTFPTFGARAEYFCDPERGHVVRQGSQVHEAHGDLCPAYAALRASPLDLLRTADLAEHDWDGTGVLAVWAREDAELHLWSTADGLVERFAGRGEGWNFSFVPTYGGRELRGAPPATGRLPYDVRADVEVTQDEYEWTVRWTEPGVQREHLEVRIATRETPSTRLATFPLDGRPHAEGEWTMEVAGATGPTITTGESFRLRGPGVADHDIFVVDLWAGAVVGPFHPTPFGPYAVIALIVAAWLVHARRSA